MAHGYCVANALSGLAAAAFDLLPSGANAAYLNDGRMGRMAYVDSASPALTADFYVDFGSARSLSGIAVLNCNASGLSVANTVEVGASPTTSFAVDGVAIKSASATLGKDIALQFPASTAYRYWLVRFRLAAAWRITIGELFALGSITSLTRNGAYGSGEGAEVILASSQMQGGERRYAKFGGPFYERRYSFADWSASELAELQAMWTATDGPVTPMLWVDKVAQTSVAAPAAEQRCLYGHIQDARFDWTQDDFGVYQPPGLVLRSRAREMGS